MDSQQAALERFFAVIPAGGIGSRLWPMSRANAPKFLHDLTGNGQTLLQDTWDRLQPIASGRTMVVTGDVHARAVAAQLPQLDQSNVILEPSPRDSTAAIALAAAVLAHREPGVIIGSFAADHVIEDAAKFQKTVQEAVLVAATGKIVTIGVRPTEPSVAFGYIKKGERLATDTACEVLEFVEKPDIVAAREYLASNDYLWNAGMFIAPAEKLLEVLAKSQPTLHEGVIELARVWDTAEREEAMEKIWPTLTKIAIDYSVAEPAARDGDVAVVPGDFEWHDVGDFAAIAELQSQGRRGHLAVLGSARVLSDSSSGILVSDTGRLVALIGLDDVIVVDTEDALLVTSKEHAQKVKSLVDSLRESGHSELL
ncbi:MAG: mannose-1-phosphate guanylyltransferase [Aquiluna sp.]